MSESEFRIVVLIVEILFLVLVCYLLSLVPRISIVKMRAQENRSIKEMVTLVLGTVAGLSIFFTITHWSAWTSLESPPNGVVWGINEGTGAVFINTKTDEELPLGDMQVLHSISNERFLRYLLPPFARESCYTGNWVACRWSDFDVASLEDKYEWGEYLLRIALGILFGIVTAVATWSRSNDNNSKQVEVAG